MHCLLIASWIASGHQLGAANEQLLIEVLHFRAQRDRIGRAANGFCRIDQRIRIIPIGFLAQEGFDPLAMLLSLNRVDCAEEVQDEVYQLLWTVAGQHLRGAVKAVEMELVDMRRIRIVLSHPLHQLSIGIKAAKAVAEAQLQDIIE